MGKKISESEFEEIVNIKLKMSCKNFNINENSKDKIIIKPYSLLGYVEGEGTYGYKYTVPYFQLAQHVKNRNVLDSINMFFSELIKNKISTSELIDFHMSKVINKKTNILSYILQNVEILYK